MRLPSRTRLSGSGQEYSAMAGTSVGHREDRRLEARVGAAAEEVPAQAVPDLLGARAARVRVEQRLARHHEAGRAEAALRGVVLDEGRLQRVQGAAFRAQALDGLDRRVLRLD